MADQTLYLKATTTKVDFYTDASGTKPGNASFGDVEEDTKFHFKRCQNETFQFQQIAFRALLDAAPTPRVESTSLQSYVAGSNKYPVLPSTAIDGKCPVYTHDSWQTKSDRLDFVLRTCSASEICVEDTHTWGTAGGGQDYEYLLYIKIGDTTYVADPQIYNKPR